MSWQHSSGSACKLSHSRPPGACICASGAGPDRRFRGPWRRATGLCPFHLTSLHLCLCPSRPFCTLPPRSVTPTWGSTAAYTRQPGIATNPGPARGSKLAVAHAHQPQIHDTHMEQQGLRAAGRGNDAGLCWVPPSRADDWVWAAWPGRISPSQLRLTKARVRPGPSGGRSPPPRDRKSVV